MGLSRKIITAAAPLSLILLGACAQGLNTRVSRFQAMPPPAQGETFIVQARNPALQGGIEFQNYARLVARQLTAVGYREAADPRDARLVVSIDYDVDQGREKVESVPGWGGYGGWGWGGLGGHGAWGGHGGWGGWGGGFYPHSRLGWRYGFYDPWLWGGGFGGNDIRSYTVYQSQLRMEVDSTQDGKRLFEGTAKALSRSDDLTYLVPNLIEAMFTGFPGNSGETVRITVPPPAKARR